MDELYERVSDSLKKEALAASRRWNGILQPDDIEQCVWEWVLTRPSARKYLSAAEPWQIKSAFRTRADIVCSQERSDYERFTGNYHYNLDDVRRILDKASSFRDQAKFDDEKVDLELGLDKLRETNPNYVDIIERRFFNNEPFKDRSEVSRCQRAVAKLCSVMNVGRGVRTNNRTEGLGTRPKISKNHDMYENAARGATFEQIIPGHTTSY